MFVFDLKGSSVDRKTKGKTKPSTTLKDTNFLFCCEKNVKSFISLNQFNRKKLIFALRKDIKFLKSAGLMDYSLLLSIEKRDKKLGYFSLNNESENC